MTQIGLSEVSRIKWFDIPQAHSKVQETQFFGKETASLSTADYRKFR